MLGLYSVVRLYVHQDAERLALSPHQAARYPKPASTCADALAFRRRRLWCKRTVMLARSTYITGPISPKLQCTLDAIRYAP